MINRNTITQLDTKFNVLAAILLIGAQCFAADIYEPIKTARNEFVFSNSSKEISSIDPTPTSNTTGSTFPGGRGANQLVIYTPEFGDRTNTNEFGTEAIVQNGIVTMISGANSFIPQDGIVISGHGTAKIWMTKNIAIGTKIYIDKENNTLNSFITSESYMYEAEEKIKETRSMIDYYRGKAPNYAWKSASNHIENAKDYLKKAKKDTDEQEHVKKYAELSIEEANKALATVLPALPNELKGVWIRPTEKTAAQIAKTIEKMDEAGVSDIFLETFYHGKTIFPSKTMGKYGFTAQNELFAGIDPLKIWIKEAHKKNMKVHIWFQSFYVGNTPPSYNPQSILSVQTQWGNKLQKDYASSLPSSSKSEHNGYFLDPANPQVQDFLTQLITEIICDYSPDGINLDYIRYPQSVSKNETGNWGYTEYARKDFKDMYGVDPIDIKKTDPLWDEWNNYRREHITNFVRKIGTLCKQKKVYISTVIFPDIENALTSKQQDWRTWSKRNYINGFTPLFLTYDPKMVSSMMKDIVSIKSSTTDVYAGIFVTFMGGSNEDLIRQIHEARKLDSNGVILFDWAHTTEKYSTMLSNSAFKHCNKKEEIKPEKEKKKKKFWFFKK